jgi:hypothetical protein
MTAILILSFDMAASRPGEPLTYGTLEERSLDHMVPSRNLNGTARRLEATGASRGHRPSHCGSDDRVLARSRWLPSFGPDVLIRMVLNCQMAVPLGRRWADKVRQMNSMPNPEQTDPHDVAVAALKEAYQQIGRADTQLPRVSKSEPDAARNPSDQQKRLAVAPRRSSRGRLAIQGLIGLLMAACIGVAAIALQSHSDAAKQVTARWAPQLYLISSPAPESPVLARSSQSAVQASAAKAAPPQPALPAPPAQTALAGAAPTAAAPSPGQEQLLQSMARERAAVEQEIEQLKTSIEQLKTSQEQMIRNNAAVAEQLKAAQEQMVRDNAAVAEQLKASQEQMVRDSAAVAQQLNTKSQQL